MHTVTHNVNVIEVKNVSFAYHEHRVLNNINLTIHRGDYLGIVGGNGSGKTTLLKIILGLLQPSAGSVILFGNTVADFKEWTKIGYVPQKVTNFDAHFPATVEEVALMGRYGVRGLFHRLKQDDRDAVNRALNAVDMWKYRHTLIGDLSSGQQQRVFIARALAGNSEVIFLDEPTVGVEKKVKDEFYALLRKMNRELGLTVVLITHDIESMAHEAMHVACLDCTLFFHDSVDTYFKNTHQIIRPHP
jgi:zinc transport system ATP-binding protein